MTLVRVNKAPSLERVLDRWTSPWNALEGIHSELNRFFDDSFGVPEMRRALAYTFVPAVDVYETANEIVVKADLPGVAKEELEISIEDSVLTIKGERQSETRSEDQRWTYCERTSGSFSRSMQLPEVVDAEKVKASFKEGVLEVHVPKTEKAKPRRIDVEV